MLLHSVDFHRPVYNLLGLPLDAVGMLQAAQRLEHARTGDRPFFLSTPNLNFLVAAQDDAQIRDSVRRSDLSIADGMPLVWLARLLGLPIFERVSGSGLFEHIRANTVMPWRVFFFGGQDGLARQAAEGLAGQPGMQPAGWAHPGFGTVEEMSNPHLLALVNRSDADLLVISLGAAKGQAWICRNLPRLRPLVVSHLGAVVNFVAGSVQRAPGWVQRIGMEWAWRIKEEPHLWQRYASDGFALARIVVTRVTPLAVLQRWWKPPQCEFDRATVELQVAAGRVTLRGAWQAANLEPVRIAFDGMMAPRGTLHLDLRAVSYVDAAFVALLTLLDCALSETGGKLRIEGMSARVRRLLELHRALPK